MDYKATLNLPKTGFPMKANLPKLDPGMLERWEAMDIYGRIRRVSAKRPLWILHDGRRTPTATERDRPRTGFMSATLQENLIRT